MTSRWFPEGDQHCMLTASVILQCICIVIVEAFNHNSITTKNIFSSQVLITLTHSPSSLTSVTSVSVSSVPASFAVLLTPCLHSPASLTPYSVILTHPTQSRVSLFINLSLLASSSRLSYSLPLSFPHSCLTHSLTHSPA